MILSDALVFWWRYFDENWKPIFNSQAGIDGLQYYADLRNKWGVTPRHRLLMTKLKVVRFILKEEQL